MISFFSFGTEELNNIMLMLAKARQTKRLS